MVKKIGNGMYECVVCGKKIDGYKKAKNHQELCGISKLDKWIDGIDLDFEKPDKQRKKSIQLNLNAERTSE